MLSQTRDTKSSCMTWGKFLAACIFMLKYGVFYDMFAHIDCRGNTVKWGDRFHRVSQTEYIKTTLQMMHVDDSIGVLEQILFVFHMYV